MKTPWQLKLPNGLIMEFPKIGTGALIYYLGYSEPEIANLIQTLLKPGMTFVDIGAHLGEYCLLASSLVKNEGKVFAFEPNPEIIPFLSKNIQRNSLKNIIVSEKAVASQEGQVSFQIHKEASMSAIINPDEEKVTNHKIQTTITVSTICLDKFFSRPTEKIDIIKMDVEGVEVEVLKGAFNLLREPADEAPIWIFEYNPAAANEHGRNPYRILEILWDNKYQIYEVDKISLSKWNQKPRISLLNESPKKTTNLIASKINLIFDNEN